MGDRRYGNTLSNCDEPSFIEQALAFLGQQKISVGFPRLLIGGAVFAHDDKQATREGICATAQRFSVNLIALRRTI
ncbi:MAG: hypothetical protein ACFB0G_02450 [Leptolyngbyaceae cyanobacterium]